MDLSSSWISHLPALITTHKHDVFLLSTFEDAKEDCSLFCQIVWSQNQQAKWPDPAFNWCILSTTEGLGISPTWIHQLSFFQMWEIKWNFHISLQSGERKKESLVWFCIGRILRQKTSATGLNLVTWEAVIPETSITEPPLSSLLWKVTWFLCSIAISLTGHCTNRWPFWSSKTLLGKDYKTKHICLEYKDRKFYDK